MKIVVTGSRGFLGSAVTAQLSLLGIPYLAVSRRREPGYHCVADYSETPAAGVLLHLAEEADRAKVNSLGETYLEHSSALVTSLIKRSQNLIYASSGLVYGDSNATPYHTNSEIMSTDFYSRSKAHNESLVLAAGGTVLRLSNLFGYGMSSNNVIADIAKQLPLGGSIKVRDDKPIRDFLHVDAAAVAIVRLLQMPISGVFNLGSGIGLSIRELAQLALNSVAQENRKIIVTNPTGRESVNILDISDTQRRLQWRQTQSPQTELRNIFSNWKNIDS